MQHSQQAAVVATFSRLLATAGPAEVLQAFDAARSLPVSTLYCVQLWDEVCSTLSLAARDPDTGRTRIVLARSRARASQQGRRSYRATLSTPPLVKGLEYDHAVVTNADGYTAAELYVALTRGQQSLTVLSKSRVAAPRSH